MSNLTVNQIEELSPGSGNITFNNVDVTGTLTFGGGELIQTFEKAILANQNTLVWSFDADLYQAARLTLVGSTSTGIESSEISIVHDGTNIYHSEYAVVSSNINGFMINTVTLVGSTVEVKTTVTSDCTVKGTSIMVLV